LTLKTAATAELNAVLGSPTSAWWEKKHSATRPSITSHDNSYSKPAPKATRHQNHIAAPRHRNEEKKKVKCIRAPVLLVKMQMVPKQSILPFMPLNNSTKVKFCSNYVNHWWWATLTGRDEQQLRMVLDRIAPPWCSNNAFKWNWQVTSFQWAQPINIRYCLQNSLPWIALWKRFPIERQFIQW
jgi:hypothetical protein